MLIEYKRNFKIMPFDIFLWFLFLLSLHILRMDSFSRLFRTILFCLFLFFFFVIFVSSCLYIAPLFSAIVFLSLVAASHLTYSRELFVLLYFLLPRPIILINIMLSWSLQLLLLSTSFDILHKFIT